MAQPKGKYPHTAVASARCGSFSSDLLERCPSRVLVFLIQLKQVLGEARLPVVRVYDHTLSPQLHAHLRERGRHIRIVPGRGLTSRVSRSFRARAGLRPAVDIATVTSPFLTTEGAMKLQRWVDVGHVEEHA